jgi:hypothetical protein
MIPSGIKPATFRFQAQYLSQLRYRATYQLGNAGLRAEMSEVTLAIGSSVSSSHAMLHLV